MDWPTSIFGSVVVIAVTVIIVISLALISTRKKP